MATAWTVASDMLVHKFSTHQVKRAAHRQGGWILTHEGRLLIIISYIFVHDPRGLS